MNISISVVFDGNDENLLKRGNLNWNFREYHTTVCRYLTDMLDL